jgi:hypothetical protein
LSATFEHGITNFEHGIRDFEPGIKSVPFPIVGAQKLYPICLPSLEPNKVKFLYSNFIMKAYEGVKV